MFCGWSDRIGGGFHAAARDDGLEGIPTDPIKNCEICARTRSAKANLPSTFSEKLRKRRLQEVYFRLYTPVDKT